MEQDTNTPTGQDPAQKPAQDIPQSAPMDAMLKGALAAAMSGGKLTDEQQAAALAALYQQWKANDDKRDAGLPASIPEVRRFADIPYGDDPRWNILDVCLPVSRETSEAGASGGTASGSADAGTDADASRKLPVIVNIHGGGWFYGTKETYQFYALGLAKEGFAVVNFNYRLAPKAKYPDELDDVNRVMHWVADPANARKYHFDTDNVFLVGDSAGGQMLMQYLVCLTDADYRARFGYTRPDLTVRAVADNCGASFITLPGMTMWPVSAYFTPQVLKDHYDDLGYERLLTPEVPPIFVMTANRDAVRDCSVRLDGFLLAKGINHEFHSYGTDADPRGHVFHVDQKDPLAARCNADEIAFFRRYLKR